MGYLSMAYGSSRLNGHGFTRPIALGRSVGALRMPAVAARRSPWLRRPGTSVGANDVAPVVRPVITASTAQRPLGAFWRDGYRGHRVSRHSLVHELDLGAAGAASFYLPNALFGEESRVLGGKLYQLTWMEHRCLSLRRRHLRLLTQSHTKERGGSRTTGTCCHERRPE